MIPPPKKMQTTQVGLKSLTGSDIYFCCANFSTIKAARGKIGRERLQLSPEGKRHSDLFINSWINYN